MHEYTHNSAGDGQDSKVDYRQKWLCDILKVSAVIHVQPEDGGKSDCSVSVRNQSSHSGSMSGMWQERIGLTAKPTSE